MNTPDWKVKKTLVAILSLLVLLNCFQLTAFAKSNISTDKNTYLPNEQIRVYYDKAPGSNGDWVCISPIASQDNIAGDYQYIPYGSTQGRLIFTAPSAGQYEARAYYNYRSKGYVVAARHAFTVANDSAASGATPQSSTEKTVLQDSGWGVGYFISELSGNAKPEGGISESVPVTKKYQARQSKLWKSVQDVLDDQGYFFSADSSSGRIKTDPRVLGEQDKVAMFGATYSVVASIKVDGSSVSFKARFNKQSNVVMGGALLEYPEKENELRKEFFTALDARLQQ